MTNKFTLVVPTYNEALIIGETLQTLITACTNRVKIPWQIIVADNASTDDTAKIVEAFNDPRVVVLRLTEKGRGRAIRAAFRAAGGGIVGFTDADLPIQPSEIIQGMELVLGGDCEVVIGTRFAKGGDVSKRTWLRNGSSMIFHLLAKIITGLKKSDSQCPLKIMNERTTPIMLATKDPTWWSELEFALLVERLGINFKELTVVWQEERYPDRKSTVKVIRDGLRAIGAMFKIRLALKQQVADLRKVLN